MAVMATAVLGLLVAALMTIVAWPSPPRTWQYARHPVSGSAPRGVHFVRNTHNECSPTALEILNAPELRRRCDSLLGYIGELPVIELQPPDDLVLTCGLMGCSWVAWDFVEHQLRGYRPP
jgi:hypothetical protein